MFNWPSTLADAKNYVQGQQKSNKIYISVPHGAVSSVNSPPIRELRLQVATPPAADSDP